jgi:hypothetical protein
MDLEFKKKNGKETFPGAQKTYTASEKQKSLCDRSIDGADDEILLHPPADLFELEKM